MKTTTLINKKVFIIILISILLVSLMPSSVFADNEGEQTKEEEFTALTLEGFWARYHPEDAGYHVVDPKEKIWYLQKEEPLEFQIIREDGDEPLLDHFAEMAVNRVFATSEDPDKINYEKETPPSYDVSEDNGVLTFIINKDNLNSLKEGNRYEFIFNFDDGVAFGLAFATEKDNLLSYTEDGHVWIVGDTETSDSPPEPGRVLPQSSGEAPASESVQLITEDTSDDVSETTNIILPVILVGVIIVASALLMAYRFKIKKKVK